MRNRLLKLGSKGRTVAFLVIIFAVAFALRASFGMYYFLQHGPVLAGNDPYYHARIIEHLLEGKGYIRYDPMLAYPRVGVNPRPPLYEVCVAFIALIVNQFVHNLDWAVYFSGALFTSLAGALAVIPVYLLSKELFGRRAGYVAAFFMAVAPVAIQRSVFGFADWDAFVMLLGMFGFWAYYKMLKAADGKYVENSLKISSYKNLVKVFKNKEALKYSILTGIIFGLLSITWPGYPMFLATIAIYIMILGLYCIYTKKDFSGEYVLTLVSLAIVPLFAFPVYWGIMVRTFHTPLYSIFVLLMTLIVGAILLYLRDFPRILAYPIFAAIIVGGIFLAKTFFPHYYYAAITGMGYFVKSKLYRTIAEAQPPSFSMLAYGTSLVLFIVFVFAYIWLFIQLFWKKRWEVLYILTLTTFFLYFASKAARFVFDLSYFVPIVGSYGVVKVYKYVSVSEWKEKVKFARGWRKISAAIFSKELLAILFGIVLVFPSVHYAVDAGIPYSMKYYIDQSGKWLGAFGTAFLPENWKKALEWLSHQDSSLPPPDRPGVISWWDYGFWIIQVGKHPAVADNFQNNYFAAGRFIAATNETAAIEVLTGLVMQARNDSHHPVLTEQQQLQIIMKTLGVNESKAQYIREQLMKYNYVNMTLPQAVQLYHAFRMATGKAILYFIVDIRLLPYDLPFTPYIDHLGIFYAPVYLANYNISKYYQIEYVTNMGTLNQTAYQKLLREGKQVRVYREVLKYEPDFYKCMFYKAYVGTPAKEGLPSIMLPGYDTIHFKPVYIGNGIRILKYYDGAIVEGYVKDTQGRPVNDTTVAVVVHTNNGLNVTTDETVTNSSGFYRLIVPGGNVTIAVIYGKVGHYHYAAVKHLYISDEQAYRIKNWIIKNVNLTVKPTLVILRAYYDKNNDGQYEPLQDVQLKNVTFDIRGYGKIFSQNGTLREYIVPGNRNVTVSSPGFYSTNTTLAVGGNVTYYNLSLTPKPVKVTVKTWYDFNHNGKMDKNETIPDITLSFSPTKAPYNFASSMTVTIGANGTGNVTLSPGSYVVYGRTNARGINVAVFKIVNIPLGAKNITLPIELEKAGILKIYAKAKGNVSVAGAPLEIISAKNPLLWTSGVLTKNGTYETMLPMGSWYTVHIYVEGVNVTYTYFDVIYVGGNVTMYPVLTKGALINGTVWYDLNHNGTMQSNEVMTNGYVYLVSGGQVIEVSPLTSTGKYSFHVPYGNYTIHVVAMAYTKVIHKTISVSVNKPQVSLNICMSSSPVKGGKTSSK